MTKAAPEGAALVAALRGLSADRIAPVGKRRIVLAEAGLAWRVMVAVMHGKRDGRANDRDSGGAGNRMALARGAP